MTALAIILASGLLAMVGSTVALALRNGRQAGDLELARASAHRWQTAHSEALSASQEALQRRELVSAELKARLRAMRERLETHEDPEVRSAAAIDGVLDLLQGWPGADSSRADDHRETSEVPTSDSAAGAQPGPG